MNPAPESGMTAGQGRSTDTGRTATKRRSIVTAARTIFLRKGYGRASMDEIAALAEVSKQTVYKQFADKQQLFATIITTDIDATERLTGSMVENLGVSQDLESDLRRFARRHIVEVTQPDTVRLRRMIIAEAERFPELATAWYAQGPERGHASLAEQIAILAERGVLRAPDPLLAAQELNWLILSIPLNRAMFHGPDGTFSPVELDRYADEAVRIFLSAYRSE